MNNLKKKEECIIPQWKCQCLRMPVVFGISEILKRNSRNAAQQLHTVMIKWCKCSGVMCKWHTENECWYHLWYLVSELPQQSITLFCYWAVNLNCIQGLFTERLKMEQTHWKSENVFATVRFFLTFCPQTFFHCYVFVIFQLFSWIISTHSTNLNIFSFVIADFIEEMSNFFRLFLHKQMFQMLLLIIWRYIVWVLEQVE